MMLVTPAKQAYEGYTRHRLYVLESLLEHPRSTNLFSCLSKVVQRHTANFSKRDEQSVKSRRRDALRG
jgi:hypothetical protein